MRVWRRSQRAPAPSAPDRRDELVDEEFQRRLEYLAVVARRLYSGRSRAERRSKRTGSGVEFADHRNYVAGDDIRYLNWNAYQRHGRLLLRLFEEEEDLWVYLLLDCSHSMSFGNPSKLRYAKQVAAALGYISLNHLDRVAILGFGETMRERLAPTRGKKRIFKALDFLHALRAEGQTRMAESMRAFVSQNKRRGVAIVISDLYDPSGFEEGINALRYGKFEPYVLQVFDPQETKPQIHGDVRLVDSETGQTRDVTVTPRVLERYARAHARYRRRIEEFCHSKHVPYFALDTTIPFDEAILGVLRRGGMVG